MASSRGQQETDRLRTNIQDQLNRLVSQLEDLEEMKDEMDPDEYNETKEQTIDQMKEFQAFLKKAIGGNMTLVNEFGSVQLAIQAAVSKAFQTPEVIKLFAKKQPGQLRNRLESLKRDVKLNKLTNAVYTQQAVEILTALKKLGETLTGEELAFLAENMTASLSEFERVETDIGKDTQQAVLSVAGTQIKNARTK
jgi:hypothetical protein